MSAPPPTLAPTDPNANTVPGASLDLEREFPILEHWLYVNHATISPWSCSTRRAVEEFAAEFNLHGPAHYQRWLQLDAELRARIARLLGADHPERVSLLANTTDAINLVSEGLPWRTGDSMVLAAPDFPSMSLPWRRLEERGVKVREVDLRGVADPEAALQGAMDESTRLLAVSSVHWADGLLLDLPRLGQVCRDAGVLTFVDAIQHFGALPLDVDANAIDFLAAGAHKWQMGAEGVAVFCASRQARDRLRPLRLGWRMLEDPFRFDQAGRPPASDGRLFEAGTPNTLGQVALNASLSLLEAFGRERVGQRVLSNADRLAAGLSAMPGVELSSRREPARRSGIVAFRAVGWTPSGLCEALAERKLVAVARGESVRLSPHFYQPVEHLERVLEVLEAVICSSQKR
jgi:selenocysteine lyase/cysteine desulfurase